MKPPRFIERVLDSTLPVLGAVDRSAVVEHLASASLTLRTNPRGLEETSAAGFLLAANLAARLYPRIYLDAPEDLAKDAEGEIILINPRCEVVREAGDSTATLCYELPAGEGEISAAARGWNVYVDQSPEIKLPPAAPAALLAAAMGIGEAFRVLFRDQLGDRGRQGPSPFAFNLITLGGPGKEPPVPDHPNLGHFNLIGAGAIGQAAAKTIALCAPRATMIAIDHEKITLSNLQRYLLTRDPDPGVVKVDLLTERLGDNDLEIVPVPTRWQAALGGEGIPSLIALDTAQARIEVQAALPGPIYNAWTQPADIGFSRHERFGEDPCLACLYWPDRPRPSRHEQIGMALRQHPARCLAYLVHAGIPVGVPLPPEAVGSLAGTTLPPEVGEWSQRPILDDIATTAAVDLADLAPWRERSLADLYQEGICGGAILDLGIGEAPQEALVPLAHQSAFAGIMLAVQFIAASVPELREARSDQTEGRYDLLSAGEQVLGRPRLRSPGCFCSDVVYRAVYAEKST